MNKHPIIEQLRRERRLREWSQDVVAAELDKGQNSVSRYESGRHIPLLTTLDKWASVLGYEVVLQPKSDK